MPRTALCRLLAALAEERCGVSAARMRDLLLGSSDDGEEASSADPSLEQQLEWACRFQRGRSVVQTPAVHVFGVRAPQVEPRWTSGQWLELLASLCETSHPRTAPALQAAPPQARRSSMLQALLGCCSRAGRQQQQERAVSTAVEHNNDIEESPSGVQLPREALGFTFGAGSPTSPVVDLFLDLSSERSTRLFATIHDATRPGGILFGQATFVLRLAVLSSSHLATVLAEAALAVKQLTPAKLLPFCRALCEHRVALADAAAKGLSRAALASMLARIASSPEQMGPLGGVPAAHVTALLAQHPGSDGTPECAMTQLLQWSAELSANVQYLPAVRVHGVDAPQVTADWTAAQLRTLLGQCES